MVVQVTITINSDKDDGMLGIYQCGRDSFKREIVGVSHLVEMLKKSNI